MGQEKTTTVMSVIIIMVMFNLIVATAMFFFNGTYAYTSMGDDLGESLAQNFVSEEILSSTEGSGTIGETNNYGTDYTKDDIKERGSAPAGTLSFFEQLGNLVKFLGMFADLIGVALTASITTSAIILSSTGLHFMLKVLGIAILFPLNMMLLFQVMKLLFTSSRTGN